MPTGFVAQKVAQGAAAAEKAGQPLASGSLPVYRKGRAEVHLVPYSEHSNFAELKEYVAFLKPHKVWLGWGWAGRGVAWVLVFSWKRGWVATCRGFLARKFLCWQAHLGFVLVRRRHPPNLYKSEVRVPAQAYLWRFVLCIRAELPQVRMAYMKSSGRRSLWCCGATHADDIHVGITVGLRHVYESLLWFCVWLGFSFTIGSKHARK